jgi:hypothetical protein
MDDSLRCGVLPMKPPMPVSVTMRRTLARKRFFHASVDMGNPGPPSDRIAISAHRSLNYVQNKNNSHSSKRKVFLRGECVPVLGGHPISVQSFPHVDKDIEDMY